ncbi:DUF1772 domain-containing protein [Nitratireductor mangrovi]|uniref:DUF1772 domain-containing protein n=1 Tax=Nitratireductor mangrovi TaxID=2599600 RepID=A0A5B8L4X3_9HYPH|nr:anthrone oxygenase family protein [Nitratireductor mangrovi]QDZ03051.1 DUF1772 domain-containing protein [Nitratireductor mangrovi]
MTLRLAANVLAVCASAAFAGAMLFIALALVAYWKSLSPAAFVDWFAANSHFIGRAMPVFILPALLGLAASAWLDWQAPASRWLWLGALAAILAVLAVTGLFHLPANARIAAGAVAPDDIPALLDRWLWLHVARILFAFAAAILAILAIAR